MKKNILIIVFIFIIIILSVFLYLVRRELASQTQLNQKWENCAVSTNNRSELEECIGGFYRLF